jgi:hypothetical protein
MQLHVRRRCCAVQTTEQSHFHGCTVHTHSHDKQHRPYVQQRGSEKQICIPDSVLGSWRDCAARCCSPQEIKAANKAEIRQRSRQRSGRHEGRKRRMSTDSCTERNHGGRQKHKIQEGKRSSMQEANVNVTAARGLSMSISTSRRGYGEEFMLYMLYFALRHLPGETIHRRTFGEPLRTHKHINGLKKYFTLRICAIFVHLRCSTPE